MTAITRASAKAYFVTGARPTQAQFADVFDSTVFQIGTSAQTITSDVSALAKLDVNGAFTVKNLAATSLTGTLAVTGVASLAVVSATSVNFGQTALGNYTEGTYTPVITLVGGAGNTVPVYSTNSGNYTRIGNRVYVDILFTGDGGAEGAGSGQFTVSLPVNYSNSVVGGYYSLGYFQNSTTFDLVLGQLTGGNLIALIYQNTLGTFTTMTGANQNNTTREVKLSFNYQV